MDRLTYFDCGKWRLKIGNMEYSGKIADRLAHYEDLTEQGRLVELPFKVGDWVYVVDRDEDGEAYEIFGYIFIASCRDVVIVSPRLYGSDDMDDILERQIAETAAQYNGDLAVFPITDCYGTLEEAEAKLAEKGGGENG